MRFAPFFPLRTKRLLLRKFRMEDASIFFMRLGSSKKVTEFMLWEPHNHISQSEASIRKAVCRYESREPYCWAITLAETGDLIGRIDLLRFDEEAGSCSFAYMLGEDFWNQGYGTEALLSVFQFAFEQLDLSEIVADHMAENPASGAVMRKTGMIYQKIVPEKYEKNGIRHDAHVYRITKDIWRNR